MGFAQVQFLKTHQIAGQTKGCPIKKNGNMYTLKWVTEEVEGINTSWVKTTVLGTTTIKDLLCAAAEHYKKACPMSGGVSPKAS